MKDLGIRECCYNCKILETVATHGPTRTVYCKNIQDIIDFPERFICDKFEPSGKFLNDWGISKAKEQVNFREVKDE